MYAALIRGQESRLSNSHAIFDVVNGYITDTVLKRRSAFQASWILAVRWIDTCSFDNPFCTLVCNNLIINFIMQIVILSLKCRPIHFKQCWRLIVSDPTPSIHMSVGS